MSKPETKTDATAAAQVAEIRADEKSLGARALALLERIEETCDDPNGGRNTILFCPECGACSPDCTSEWHDHDDENEDSDDDEDVGDDDILAEDQHDTAVVPPATPQELADVDPYHWHADGCELAAILREVLALGGIDGR